MNVRACTWSPEPIHVLDPGLILDPDEFQRMLDKSPTFFRRIPTDFRGIREYLPGYGTFSVGPLVLFIASADACEVMGLGATWLVILFGHGFPCVSQFHMYIFIGSFISKFMN